METETFNGDRIGNQKQHNKEHTKKGKATRAKA
jgi:hypothetical protein